MTQQPRQTKITTATKITLMRVLILPIIIFFYLTGGEGGIIPEATILIRFGKLIALVLFVLAAATDWLDGYVARKYNQVSDMGKMLDPIADKMLTLAGFVLIAVDFDVITDGFRGDGFLPVWFAVIVLFVAFGRDIIINGLRFVAAQKGVDIAADKYGKAKSILQYIALSMFMFYAFDAVNTNPILGMGTFLQIFEFATLFALSLATALSVVSAANYLFRYSDLYLGGKPKQDLGK
jgi:CDP-diacylglycerol--glycerol-3-phosphate 3-phosphatidyltransferase